MQKRSAPTERQKCLLAKEDWRFHAIDFVGTGLGSIATSEWIDGKVVSFSLPSAPALFLSLAAAAHKRRISIPLDESFIRHPTPQGTWPEDHKEVFNFFEAFVAEIVFAFTAIEAFVNESIPSDFTYTRQRKGDDQTFKGPEIERAFSLDEKLKLIIPAAHSTPSPTGSHAWNEYVELKQIRDRLIHLKTLDRKSSGPEQQTIWGLLIVKRSTNFAHVAVRIIGAFPALISNRRWFKLAQTNCAN